MEIENSWEEIIDFAEGLVVFIFNGLRERCKYWMGVIQREYPDAGNFKIPEGRAPRLRFSEGIAMLKEAGVEASADEDIKYVPCQAYTYLIPCRFHPPSETYSSESRTLTVLQYCQ